MNKEEILKKSRMSGKGKPDEMELNAMGIASKIGMSVGLIICLALVMVGRILEIPLLSFGAWMVYFAMQGSHGIVMYVRLKKKTELVLAIICIVTSILMCVGIFFSVK